MMTVMPARVGMQNRGSAAPLGPTRMKTDELR